MLHLQSTLSTLFLLLMNFASSDDELFDSNLTIFEGDMVLNEEQSSWYVNASESEEPISLNNDTKSLWPNGIVFYEIDDSFENKFKNQILKAFSIINERTCITFEPKKNDTIGFVYFTPSNYCSSEIGFQNKTQYIRLNPVEVDEKCFRLGSVMHEILHILGFIHQNNVWKRDDYVTIVYENIQEGMEKNFEKLSENDSLSMDMPYDYLSVMHQPKDAFSKNCKPTIVPKDKYAKIGQRKQLSTLDVIKIHTAYNCEPTSKSEN